jgi:ubiquinone/menaquinone biosynthesis C-methylase UbiE
MRSIEYHLKELEIARNKNDARHVLPHLLDSDKFILDIGCGIGQSFIALDCPDRICIGIDVDEEAIRYGVGAYGSEIQFILCDAKHIPLPSNVFDLVFSRVSLPYTNIPGVIREVRRVLRKGGRVWMTLHGKEMVIKYLEAAISSRNVKRLIHVIYILINGYSLKYLGLVFPFVNGRFESWQDPSAMQKLLARHGFQAKVYKVGGHTVLEGRLVQEDA